MKTLIVGSIGVFFEPYFFKRIGLAPICVAFFGNTDGVLIVTVLAYRH